MKSKNLFTMGMGLLLAASLFAPVPAMAATHQASSMKSDLGTHAAQASNDVAYVTSSVETVRGQEIVRLSAVRAKFEVTAVGDLVAKDNQGKVLETMAPRAIVGGVAYTLTFEVSMNGKQADVYFRSTSEASIPLPSLRVNQGCAFNNLLWGLGTGALTGAGAGVPGIVIGGLTGAIFSGIQSATSC